MVVQMLMVGEETGALDTMLEKIADFYDTEVDATVEALTSLIEPLLIAVMGVALLLVSLAVGCGTGAVQPTTSTTSTTTPTTGTPPPSPTPTPNPTPTPLPQQTFTVTVTATSGSLVHSVPVTLTLQ